MIILLILLTFLTFFSLAFSINNFNKFAFNANDNIDTIDYKMNVLRDEPDNRDFIFNLPIPKDFTLTKQDWTTFVGDVLDQGNINGCTTNAMSKALQIQENFYNWTKNIEQTNPLRSRLYIYYKSRQDYPGRIPISDTGTSLRATMKTVTRELPYEYEWPYTLENLNTQPPDTLDKTPLSGNQVVSYYRVPIDVNSMKSALIKNVLVARFECPPKLPNNHGVLKPLDKSKVIGGHALVIIGFDDTTSRFKFLNSWGIKWGDNGFGYIPYEYITDYITDIWTLYIDNKSLSSWGMGYGNCIDYTNRNTWLEHADVVKLDKSSECWFRYCVNPDKSKCGVNVNSNSVYKGCYKDDTSSKPISMDENSCHY